MKRSSSLLRQREGVEKISPNSQTLVRGLDVLEMVATGPMALPALADRLGLARSTTHRLATALMERRYLTLMPREGYVLGPKVLELGSLAQEQTALLRVARPHMEKLAADSLDTVHLTICDSGTALLLEHIHGNRRLLPSLHVGERSLLAFSAPGRALLLGAPEADWYTVFAQDCGTDCPEAAESAATVAAFILSMRDALKLGYASDADNGTDRLRCVAAPVRGANGGVLAALGLSTAAQYMDEDGLTACGRAVRDTAAAISADLGHRDTRNGKRVGNQRPEGEIAVQETPFPLEAEVACVHDQKVNGSTKTSEPDLGCAYEA